MSACDHSENVFCFKCRPSLAERTVYDDARDFGTGFALDGVRVDPARVAIYRSSANFAGKADVLTVLDRLGYNLGTGMSARDLALAAAELREVRAAMAYLIEAVEASEREHRDLEGDAPMDSGCVQCTCGATPHDRDTGPCAHHKRLAALARVQP